MNMSDMYTDIGSHDNQWHTKPFYMTLLTAMFHLIQGMSLGTLLSNISLSLAIICGAMTMVINFPKFRDTARSMFKKKEEAKLQENKPDPNPNGPTQLS